MAAAASGPGSSGIVPATFDGALLPTMTRAAVAATATHGGERVLAIVDGYVVDWTVFVGEHPGGREVLDDYIGRDATEAFLDVAHSTMARRMVAKYIVARVVDDADAAGGAAASGR